MNIKDLVIVTGMPGVQKIVANRSNGMLVEDLDNGKVRFASIRKHQFSPLESISIFLENDDAIEIKEVFRKMLDQLESLPIVSPDTDAAGLRAYFSEILPDHDRDRVHTGDIRKVIRWFNFLHDRGYTTQQDPAATETEGSETEMDA
ncbi:MAG: hypothetical protein RLY31_1852 [Bacteroidota bacterium]|jgi:hypothetical protein